jgi:hypothetical protein
MNETAIAMRVRHALNEGTGRLDYTVVLRLEKARRAALDRLAPAPAAQAAWVPALRLQPQGGAPESHGGWAWRLGVAGPLLALVLGFVAIYDWRTDQMVAEMADIDFAVLLDDTPIDTWAHRGFGVMLQQDPNNL